MAHKPNYIPVATRNSTGYDPTVYRPQAGDENLKVDDTDSRFQISIKTPLALNLFDTLDIYTTYTKRSFWQVYNREGSALAGGPPLACTLPPRRGQRRSKIST